MEREAIGMRVGGFEWFDPLPASPAVRAGDLVFVSGQFGGGGDVSELVNTSAAVFRAFASEERNIGQTVRDLPSTLRQTTSVCLCVLFGARRQEYWVRSHEREFGAAQKRVAASCSSTGAAITPAGGAT